MISINEHIFLVCSSNGKNAVSIYCSIYYFLFIYYFIFIVPLIIAGVLRILSALTTHSMVRCTQQINQIRKIVGVMIRRHAPIPPNRKHLRVNSHAEL